MSAAASEALPVQHASGPVATVDWQQVTDVIDRQGFACIESLLSKNECRQIVTFHEQPALFRSRVVMARHGFGRGEYQYFAYPLPPLVQSLRERIYAPLSLLANEWNDRLGKQPHFPRDHPAYLERCGAAGQTRPTPLLLQYGADDYNCLHQDLYGDEVFPLQVAILLSRPDTDFTGGEFVITEQRPRMQSRVSVVPLRQGDAVVFAVNERPVRGNRGTYRVRLRHGVSVVRSGHRHTLGIIFHDAR